jgi:hypothetical protein
MKVLNDAAGYINGLVHMDEVEIDLVVKALNLAKDKPMCEMHDEIIDRLTEQFEAVFNELITE